MESFKCVKCDFEVRQRQEALLCEGCNRWQHRTCGTGVTREEYRAAIRSGGSIDWRCLQCQDDSFDPPQCSTPKHQPTYSPPPSPRSPLAHQLSPSSPQLFESSLADPVPGEVQPEAPKAII